MEVKRVVIKNDPTGTQTVTVIALNDKGQVIIGHSGGCRVSQVSEAVTDIINHLTVSQDHYATTPKNGSKKG